VGEVRCIQGMTSEFLLLSLSWRGLPIKPHHLRAVADLNFNQWRGYLSEQLGESFFEFENKQPGWREKSEQEWKWLEKNRAQVCYINSSDYPILLSRLENPPLALTYLGSPCWINRKGIAVVGSRQPDPSTLTWLDQELAPMLAQPGCFSISGGARGVDQKCHSVSLKTRTPTVSWMPSGLSQIYPKGFQQWVSAIVEQGGAVVSTFSPMQPMYKSQFHVRNRWIVGMANAVVIAEARLRSGTLLTAQIAIDEGKSMGVVPCSPMLPTGRGGLNLINDGALMLRDRWDLRSLLNDSH